MHQRKHLSHRDAQAIVAAIAERLERDGRGAAVAVVDDHGELLAFLRTDGCPLASIHNAVNKAFTAARERKPSAEVGRASHEDPFPMTNFGDLRYTAWGGGVPILIDGQVAGAVGVSGLPEAEDVALAEFGATLLSDE